MQPVAGYQAGTLPGSVRARQAALYDQRRQRRAVPETTLGRPDRVAAEVPDVADECLSDAAQRSVPATVYAETAANAGAAKLAPGGNGVTGTKGGIPFPAPKDGLEAIWNTMLRYRGDTYATRWRQAAVTRGGPRRWSTSITNSTSTTAISTSRRETATTTGSPTCCKRSPGRQASPVGCCWWTNPSITQRRRAARGPTTRAQRRVRLRRMSPTTIRAPPPTACAPATTSRCTTARRTATSGSSSAGRRSTFRTTRTGFRHRAEGRGPPAGGPCQSRLRALRAAPRLGRGGDAEAGREPHLREARLLHRRGQLDDRRHRHIRHAWRAMAGCRAALDQLLRRADALRDGRGAHRPAVGRYLAMGLRSGEPRFFTSIRRDPGDYTPAAMRGAGHALSRGALVDSQTVTLLLPWLPNTSLNRKRGKTRLATMVASQMMSVAMTQVRDTDDAQANPLRAWLQASQRTL